MPTIDRLRVSFLFSLLLQNFSGIQPCSSLRPHDLVRLPLLGGSILDEAVGRVGES